MKGLTTKEEEIMGFFWKEGPQFVRQLLAYYDEPKPHFNTVSTFVRSLEAKGWLSHEQFGNSFRYAPAVPVEEYRNRSLRGFIDRFFGRSYLNVVSSLVKEEKISTKELRDLIARIEAAENRKED